MTFTLFFVVVAFVRLSPVLLLFETCNYRDHLCTLRFCFVKLSLAIIVSPAPEMCAPLLNSAPTAAIHKDAKCFLVLSGLICNWTNASAMRITTLHTTPYT